MDPQREKMLVAIKERVVPALRDLGFRGSFPHFRRIGSTQMDLLSFQFYSSGGRFVVEIAKCPPGGIVAGWGKEIPPSKLNVTYFRERFRLGSDPSTGEVDHWYEFGKRSYEAGHQEVKADAFYRQVAEKVVSDLVTQAVPWWGSPAA
jgi:hypothetical protein